MNNKAHLRPKDYDKYGDIFPSGWKEEKEDLISREALRKAFHGRIWYFTKSSWDEANALIDSATTVEPDMEFAKWVTKMIFDNGVEDFDFELFSELACRKLEKLGLVEKTESEWIKKGSTE